MNFIKSNQLCSNVYLIDENLCAGNTLNLINYNTISLTSALIDVQRYANQWNNLYTIMSTYSAKLVDTSTIFANNSSRWMEASKIVSTYYQDWNKPFTIVYPKLIKIENWLTTSEQEKIKELQNWLLFNFVPIDYIETQIVNVSVLLYQEKPYQVKFNSSYKEECIPNVGGVVATCDDQSCGNKPHIGCNHHGGLAGVKACDNVYDYCTKKTVTRTGVEYSCKGSGGKVLSLNYSKNLADRSTTRNLIYKFQMINNNWNYIT